MSSCASLVLGQYNPRNNPEVVIEGNVSEPVTITTSYKKYKDVRLPQRVEIDRHKIDGQHIKIESSNYVYQDIVIKKKRNPWTICNFLLVGVPGWLIDMWSNNVSIPTKSSYELEYQPK